MRSYLAFSALVVVLLVGAVGLKIGFRGLNEADGPDVRAQVVSLALAGGFWIDQREPNDSQMDVIGVSRGLCTATIAFVSPLGWHRDSIKRSAVAGDRVFFLYRGHRYADQPLWDTVLDHYRRRLSRLLGNQMPPYPILGVIASPQCAPDSMAWLDQVVEATG